MAWLPELVPCHSSCVLTDLFCLVRVEWYLTIFLIIGCKDLNLVRLVTRRWLTHAASAYSLNCAQHQCHTVWDWCQHDLYYSSNLPDWHLSVICSISSWSHSCDAKCNRLWVSLICELYVSRSWRRLREQCSFLFHTQDWILEIFDFVISWAQTESDEQICCNLTRAIINYIYYCCREVCFNVLIIFNFKLIWVSVMILDALKSYMIFSL